MYPGGTFTRWIAPASPGALVATRSPIHYIDPVNGYRRGMRTRRPRKAPAKQPPAEQKAITEKYGDMEKTPLTKEVKKGSQTIDLALD